MERFIVTLILAMMGASVIAGVVTVLSSGAEGIVTMACILAAVAAAWWIFLRIFGGGRG